MFALHAESAGGEASPRSAPYRAGVAWSPLTLADSETAAADLELEEVPVDTVSGSVHLPNGVALSSFEEHYRFPFPNAFVGFPNASVVGAHPTPTAAAFAFDLPRVSIGGATLCLAATGDGGGTLRTERCGTTPESPNLILELQSAPVLAAPPEGSVFDPNTRFSWSPFEKGISELEFRSENLSGPSVSVHVFVGGTQFSWTELGEASPFPAADTYTVKVSGIGPFLSIDDAVGTAGLAAPIRAETRRSTSPSVLVRAAAP